MGQRCLLPWTVASLEEKGHDREVCNNSDDDNIFEDGKDNKEATTTSLHHALAKLAEEGQRHKRSDAHDENIRGVTLLANANGGFSQDIGGSTLLCSPQNTRVDTGVRTRDSTFPVGTEGEPGADGESGEDAGGSTLLGSPHNTGVDTGEGIGGSSLLVSTKGEPGIIGPTLLANTENVSSEPTTLGALFESVDNELYQGQEKKRGQRP